MRIVFRADASLEIGTGHVMRCLTLAETLRTHEAQCLFICREHPGNLLELIRQRGFEACALPLAQRSGPFESAPAHAAWLGATWSDDARQTQGALADTHADWLIVDHYALDERWEQALRPFCRRLMVIDDLADRPHDCDLLLDQNLGHDQDIYSNLVPPACTRLIGSSYALLRPEFSALRRHSLARRGTWSLKRLLITMGGVDATNATGLALEALATCVLPTDCKITVVMGPHAPWLELVRKSAQQLPWPCEVLCGTDAMAKIMAEADLAIGASGSTSWERCCLGLPTILVPLAENQHSIAEALRKRGAVIAATYEQLGPTVRLLLGATDTSISMAMAEMSSAASELVDGLGCARIAGHLLAQEAG